MILMYHGITASNASMPPERETGADIYDTPVEKFKEQMRLVKESGREIIITFDDGEMNNFTHALPILKEYNLVGHFFIIVKRVGTQGYMGWREIHMLIQEGMRVGSHGLTHEILTNLKESQMEEELRASKSTMEINLGNKIDELSIPRGFCDDKVISTAYTLGYKTIFISERPRHLKSQCLSRVAVKEHWTLKRFKMAIENKTPILEVLAQAVTRTIKFIFRESGYNFIRTMIIKIIK